METTEKITQKEYIKEQIAVYNNKIIKLGLKYNGDVLKIKEWIAKLQKKCKHEETVYHPDPSGNKDSWTECDICGLSVNRF